MVCVLPPQQFDQARAQKHPSFRPELSVYFKIAQHYNFALSYLFTRLGYDRVIIIEGSQWVLQSL